MAIFTALSVTLLVALCSSVTQGVSISNSGDGNVVRLNVVQDVTLERPGTNFNFLKYLLVGRHPQFPLKRSLIQFENFSYGNCPANKIRWAKMYVYFVYAHKASWHSVTQTPYLSHKIQVHTVKRRWAESQATSSRPLIGQSWSQTYLGLNNQDAESRPQYCSTFIYAYRPRGFVEFDVTRAVRDWRSGRKSNYGLLLKVKDEKRNGRDLRFASNADADPKKHAFINVMCNY
ncbi:uncharacterized protein LOC116295241 [Actinia tenebrosa]|uniref:Uncharacterized protein LOC116295241 n=1 Tax=Actinia tenebrosa TaxID=6105 RepID=A0A6P8I1W5_ACTTE|nr:uncharacterized protein LOC116295241 [Actinia tenebrosa]